MTQTNNEREEYENFEAWLCTLNSFSPSELRFGFLAWQAAKQSQISQNEQQEAVDALRERDRLGFAVVEVIGKLDEIIDVAEDIEFNDFAHISIPLELWNELKDALELMPERADNYTSPPKQVIPEGWKLVPIVPNERMLDVGESNYQYGEPSSYKAGLVYKAMLNAAPTNTEVGE